MFGKQIAASDILNGEEAKLPARRYRMDQLFRVLADREEYRSQLAESAKRFMGLYPRLRRGGFFFGLAVPAIVTPLLSLLGFEKVIMLTCWLIWLHADSRRNQAHWDPCTDPIRESKCLHSALKAHRKHAKHHRPANVAQ